MSDKRIHRENRSINRRWELQRMMRHYAGDILESSNYRNTKYHMQHGHMSVRQHTFNVARCSVAMSEKLQKLGIRCDTRALIRGALLHDYFLYDWHDKEHLEIHNLHGFYHPGIALQNASKEYDLSPLEQDIIKKHMWPLTVVPPMCREAWIVTAADKYCSLLETLRLQGEKKKTRKQRNTKTDIKDMGHEVSRQIFT